jgi:phosphate:Na+ symporter
MAAAMVLGANIGTTANAPLAAIGGTIATKRTALAHVMFNVIGAAWALPLLFPLLRLVDVIMPGDPTGAAITAHLAGLHTIYNIINVSLFLPFINKFAKLVTWVIRDKQPVVEESKSKHYKFSYLATIKTNTPEFNILRVEKEISDMAGIVSSMYSKFSSYLQNLLNTPDKESAVVKLWEELKQEETYVDEMRETLTGILIECTRDKLSTRSERRVSLLLRAIGDIEEMSDECYGISRLLEKSVRKNRIFKKEEMDELVPYVDQVGEFLNLLRGQLGQSFSLKAAIRTKKLEANIGKSRKRLQKLSRKRIESGKNVQTELLFIDLVRRIEKLGDYCINISGNLGKPA